jgi:hypothetical protein
LRARLHDIPADSMFGNSYRSRHRLDGYRLEMRRLTNTYSHLSWKFDRQIRRCFIFLIFPIAIIAM